jgi:hypothetical protein
VTTHPQTSRHQPGPPAPRTARNKARHPVADADLRPWVRRDAVAWVLPVPPPVPVPLPPALALR